MTLVLSTTSGRQQDGILRRGWALLLLILFFLLPACSTPAVRLPAPPVRYLELALAYNYNVAMMDQLWSRASLEMQWVEQGKKQSESGNGHLMLIPPNRMALSVGQLGQTYFWAGCDATQYWLFDLRDGGVVYVGTHERFDPGRFREVPIPVRPLDVAKLLGLVYLPMNEAPRDTVLVPSEGSDWVLELPEQKLRLRIDPATFTARAVQLLDDRGRVRVESVLQKPSPVALKNASPRDGPKLPREVTIRLPEDMGMLRLSLSNPSDGREDDRLRPRQFDWQALLKAHKPARIVNLDER